MDENSLLHNVREQYNTTLQDAIVIGLFEGIKTLWDTAKETADSGSVYSEFQTNLKKVKTWNQTEVQAEYKRVVERSKCDWLDSLIKQVFKLNTQYIASVDSRTALMQLKVSVPDTATFIHECYVNSARAFWLNVPLLEDRPQKITKLKELENIDRAKAIIREVILSTVMENVPMKELAMQSLHPPSDVSSVASWDGSEPADRDDPKASQGEDLGPWRRGSATDGDVHPKTTKEDLGPWRRGSATDGDVHPKTTREDLGPWRRGSATDDDVHPKTTREDLGPWRRGSARDDDEDPKTTRDDLGRDEPSRKEDGGRWRLEDGDPKTTREDEFKQRSDRSVEDWLGPVEPIDGAGIHFFSDANEE